MDFVSDYISELVTLFNEMAPWLLFGLVFAGLLKVYFPQKNIEKYLGKPNLRSTVNASVLGVPLPLCSCGVIPTAISFYKNGASKGATNSFLISTPQTGIDSIFATYSMLGWPFAILRPLVAFSTGIFGGVMTNWLMKEKAKPIPEVNPMFAGLRLDTQKASKPVAACDDDDSGHPAPPKKEAHALIRAANYAFIELLQDIAKWLIIGFMAAALLSVLLPDGFFSMFKGYGFFEILIVLAASVPLYICATGSIPIAAVLLMKGVSPGAALVFMMAGPATNVATITVLAKTMGKKSLFIYLGSIIGGAIFFGMLTNWLIPADFILSKMNHDHGDGMAHEMLPKWVGITSSLVLVVSIIAGYFIERIKKQKKMTNETFQAFRVEGMTCSHCEASINRNLSKLDGIDEVIADRNTAQVKVRGSEINFSEIERMVTDLGYQYKGNIK
ncbi:MAG TPA: heavy metal-associated domain-containing protein [Prolixibacteraceae bacterium]|nr:heavy metal-associated domain-containing protein [Prolixibacteraceae bacterium]